MGWVGQYDEMVGVQVGEGRSVGGDFPLHRGSVC